MQPLRSWRRRTVSALLALAAGGAAAQSPPADLTSAGLDVLLDLDISGASKFTLPMSETASSVTVITADQMRALGHRTLADVLRSVRGVVVSSDRTYSYLAVRGFASAGDYNTRILLLIDGNRVNDTVYDQAFLGSELPLDLALVERVEFIPGQGSAVHGGNALFGVVNVVTRRPRADAPNEAALTLGSGRSRQLRLTGQRAVGEAQLLVSATALREAGRNVYYAGYDAPETNHGISSRTDHERSDQLFAKLVLGEVSATLIHADRIKGLSASPGTVFNDPRTLYRDTHTLGDLTLQHRLDGLSLWKLRLYGGHYDYRGDYITDVAPMPLNRDGARSTWWGVESHVFTERLDGHRLVAGADLQVSPRRDQTNEDVWPVPVRYLDDHRRGERISLLAEDQWTPMPALSLTAGARIDRAHDSHAQFNPRLALSWRPEPPWVLKVIHGTAYRLPNAYETWYMNSDAGGYKANPALREERVRGDELVAEYRRNPSSRWSMSLYGNRASGLIVQQLDPSDGQLVYRNAGAIRARGLELEAEEAWTSGVQLRANYALQRVNDLSGQDLDRDVARHLAKVVVIVPLHAGWTLGSETVLIGRRSAIAGYGVTHLTLAGPLWRERALLSLGLRDVFDRHAGDPGGDSVLQPVSPHDGRSVLLKLELMF
ncbi:TonB-dependent receptor [Piscinibacter sp. XHJ-5]|uniref:TonB-dependent receptor plug domain-containing protein n=1 Tax=Piscinibacter sp. XHJ-5 TaxID=3037797 RepID=UPI002452BF75|nr:TonB-dependent receptor [Piscinibacter sp. XHJ-5]